MLLRPSEIASTFRTIMNGVNQTGTNLSTVTQITEPTRKYRMLFNTIRVRMDFQLFDLGKGGVTVGRIRLIAIQQGGTGILPVKMSERNLLLFFEINKF